MEYELVHEIKNLCRNNQMRDVFFEEVETEDPVVYVRHFLKQEAEVSAQVQSDGSTVIYAETDGMSQKFTFTPI